MARHIYAPGRGLEDTEAKIDALVGAAREDGNMLDSTSGAAVSVIKESVADATKLLPARMAALLDKIDGDAARGQAVHSLLDGIARYQYRNGHMPDAALIDAVISQAENVADGASTKVLPDGYTLDSISSNNQSTPLSHQPNRIAVAITGGLAEGMPFGAYLPSDLNSNESKLAIISAVTGSDFGGYTQGMILDGTGGGQAYTRSERILDVAMAGDRLTGTFKVTARIGGQGAQVPILRGRTRVFIDGMPCAIEVDNGTSTNQLAGQYVSDGGTSYSITGNVNIDTGEGNLTFNPALPASAYPEVQAFVDFERKPDLTPHINTKAQSWSLYCAPSRVLMQITPDARSQTQSELGADGLTIAVQAARTQAANERYIASLRKLKRIAKRTHRVYDFDAGAQLVSKTRAAVWRDFGSFAAKVDQEVANQTMEFGLNIWYVGDIGMSQFLSMDSTDFVSSGVSAKAGIWRVGKYKGKYDVYYDPYVVEETDTDIEILCVGRSAQVARNPIVLSDAVPLTLIPLAVGQDLKSGAALYKRDLTEVNPHKQSALGCALITIKNVIAG
ncbi:hypothetical protein [Pseudomonas putida]|uniref:Uncharacterized protein n=1 Tax=Pseudomonas putida TaxID=303 RepID=A0A1L7NPP7_PSEPU|nr:hypothetical protein [Pseudomonas putida]BAW27449.1 Uncharacterized protein KF715C_pC160 [Pseudomonas putida]